MTDDTFNNNCLRHPNVQSNLRCGRCGVLICPQCMMQSPVGARCPDCSKIGQAPIFRANSLEMTTTIALSAIAALGFGAVYALIVWFLLILPFNFQIGNRLLWEQIFREENKEFRMKLYSIKFFCDKCDCDIFYSISKKENDKGNLVYMGYTIESYLGENVVCHKCGDNHIVTDNDGLVSSTIIKRNN